MDEGKKALADSFQEEFKEEYVKAIEIDHMKLKDFLNRAKGYGRTMQQFAVQCGVSPATFSRVIHGKNIRPLSAEMIQTIILNAEDPHEFSYRNVMSWNGMVPRKYHERTDERGYRFNEYAENDKSINAKVRNIIENELKARNRMHLFYNRLAPGKSLYAGSFNLNIISHFVLRVEDYPDKLWNFYILTDVIPQEKKERALQRARFVFSDNASLFLRDIWETDSMSDIKQTFVFVDEAIYREFTELAKKVSVKGHISALLIDISEEKVVEEKPFKRLEGAPMAGIFDEEVPESGVEEDEDEGGEDYDEDDIGIR